MTPVSGGAGSSTELAPQELAEVRRLLDGVGQGDRAALAQAVTLVESSAPRHGRMAQALLAELAATTSSRPRSLRLGVSGAPGVGKSCFIDALGAKLLDAGHRVCVLAVDPSSTISGGSILGDKTRMARLCADDRAFVRPSPSGGSLGGVTRRTREAMLVSEAAGYDLLIVETVGVGQSEVAVHSMVDFFLLLVLPEGGDALQGIKKGVVELADALSITKADGDRVLAAERTCEEYTAALHLLSARDDGWAVPVTTCSSVTGAGIDELWQQIAAFHGASLTSGALGERRAQQTRDWLHQLVTEQLERRFYDSAAVRALWPTVAARVRAGTQHAPAAAAELLAAFCFDDGSAD